MDLETLQQKFTNLSDSIDLIQIKDTISNLESQLSDPKIYQDIEQANKINQELAYNQKIINQYQEIEKNLKDLEEGQELLAGLEQSNPDYETLAKELNQIYQETSKSIDDFEIQNLFKDQYDSYGAIISIKTGNGGDDAHDWSNMLYRMYQRWAENNNLNIRVDELSEGGVNGLKSVTFEIDQKFSYGKLKFENGAHRLIRKSPFNSGSTRETSFSAVEILPLLESDDEIKIEDNDLKIDVFRSSGPGGQSVNTTDSAVRITHLPTGIVVSMQNEKSQLQNKNTALKILKSKLLKLKLEAEKLNKKKLTGEVNASFGGNQIKTYTLDPYQMFKDERTGYKSIDVFKILDGEIDEVLNQEIRLLSK